MSFSNKIKRSVKVLLKKIQLKRLGQSPIRIVVGAGRIFENGWIGTEIDYLNLLKDSDWKAFFKENSITAILAEHVWEHLSWEDGLLAARQCYKYLKPGGYLRVAVPDGNHPDKDYIQRVRPGGYGEGADDHKVLYDELSIKELFEEAGFKVNLLEWFDNRGKFKCNAWNTTDGMIWRSKSFDERNKNGVLKYTSLIIDAVKLPFHSEI